MAKICLNCGKQLKENDSFCSKCGKKVKDKTVNIKSNINELKTTQKLDQHFRHPQYTIKDFVDLNDIIANIILLFFTLGIGNIFYIAYKIYEYKFKPNFSGSFIPFAVIK